MQSSICPSCDRPSTSVPCNECSANPPKPVAMVMSDPNKCDDDELPVDHWCGWPQPCCHVVVRKPWTTAKGLDHLPICHDACWRKDVVDVKKRYEAQGVKHTHYGDTENPQGYLRLCHRRCYVQDLMRKLKYTESGEDDRTEIVPCNQTLLELAFLPMIHHWVVTWMWVPLRGSKWHTPRRDLPWPKSLSESHILGTGQSEDRTMQIADEEKQVGTSGGVDGSCTWFLRIRRVF